jgi:hypothetical protein
MRESILMVEDLRGRCPFGTKIAPAGWAIRIAANFHDSVSLHMDEDLTDAVTATTGRPDDAGAGTHGLSLYHFAFIDIASGTVCKLVMTTL